MATFGVSIHQLFSVDGVNFYAREVMSERNFRRTTNCLRLRGWPLHFEVNAIADEENANAQVATQQQRGKF